MLCRQQSSVPACRRAAAAATAPRPSQAGPAGRGRASRYARGAGRVRRRPMRWVTWHMLRRSGPPCRTRSCAGEERGSWGSMSGTGSAGGRAWGAVTQPVRRLPARQAAQARRTRAHWQWAGGEAAWRGAGGPVHSREVALAAVDAVEVGGHEDAGAALGADLAQALHLARVVHLVELEHPQLDLLVPAGAGGARGAGGGARRRGGWRCSEQQGRRGRATARGEGSQRGACSARRVLRTS